MDAEEYRRLAEKTESHWWFDATSKVLSSMLDPFLATLGPDAICLDAGGGTGATGSWLAKRHRTVLGEIEPVAIGAAVERFPMYLPTRADLNHLPFADGSFDAVMCVTALCHEMNPDPAVTVAEFARVTRPGGRLLLFEPHHQWLWRGHDRITHTARRFNLPALRSLVRAAGLEVERATGAFTFLVPPALVMKLVERNSTKSDVGRNESGVGGLAAKAAALERRWLSRHDVPFGLSAIVVASKPE